MNDIILDQDITLDSISNKKSYSILEVAKLFKSKIIFLQRYKNSLAELKNLIDLST